MITKKHFKAIADIIRVNTHTAQKQGMQTYISTWAVEELINYFSQINPSFDKYKFRYVAEFNIPKNKEVA
jgi:methionine synthase I (cobalamin-dependent)